METFAAAPIFIELTLSEKAPAVADGVCSTQVTTLSNTLIPPHTQNGSALDAWSHTVLMQGTYNVAITICHQEKINTLLLKINACVFTLASH